MPGLSCLFFIFTSEIDLQKSVYISLPAIILLVMKTLSDILYFQLLKEKEATTPPKAKNVSPMRHALCC